LAVIIGKRGKYIEKSDALEHVAGYAVSNDVSFRDFQLPPGWPERLNPLGMNWVKGKGMDSSFPLGPCLATRDEIPDPHNLRISLKVNGQLKQDSNTSEMVFKIDALVEYVSAGLTLKPGDIISTGTPFGVALATGQSYLRDGDVVEGTVERIGTLSNPTESEL
jgi:2-keto-4-pentenoate hydratase/2-oxohepta-3-ene-1,7-dioic acid hydratase in catechol pathway